MPARVYESETEGHRTVVLESASRELSAAFAPEVGMIGCSLRHRGEELLGQRGGLDAYARTGSSMGIPLLHPWANRLSRLEYDVAGAHVELDPARSPLRLDGNDLPIHGVLAACPDWAVQEADAASDRARLSARLDFAGRPDLLMAFPFPHELALAVELDDDGLTVETSLRATADVAVPVAFGHHPYLRLPGVPRADWEIAMPVRRRAALDERGIPTGVSEPAGDLSGPLGDRAFDDLFSELDGATPEFTLAGGGRRLAVRFDSGYAMAQVYAPPGDEFICFEPMTAATDALVTGAGLRLVAPGESFTARFSVLVG